MPVEPCLARTLRQKASRCPSGAALSGQDAVGDQSPEMLLLELVLESQLLRPARLEKLKARRLAAHSRSHLHLAARALAVEKDNSKE